MSRVAIVQSNYVPWKGYFDLINSVDFFVLYDVVQFTKNDWRNRNRILTKQGPQWLTIPVRTKKLDQKINETEIARTDWNVKHWKTLQTNYSSAPCFSEYQDRFRELYLGTTTTLLSRINRVFIEEICAILGIKTRILDADDSVLLETDKNKRLIDICRELGAATYLSGPAARGYLKTSDFEKAGINVEWMSYSDYPEYPQKSSSFEHGVSILDLLFNTGQESTSYLNSFKQEDLTSQQHKAV